MNNAVAGFSKLSKRKKLIGLPKNTFLLKAIKLLKNYWNSDEKNKTTMNSSKIQLPTIFRLASLLIS
jgi:hypothetical protein